MLPRSLTLAVVSDEADRTGARVPRVGRLAAASVLTGRTLTEVDAHCKVRHGDATKGELH